MADQWLHIGRVTAVNAARRQIRLAVLPGQAALVSQCKRLRVTRSEAAPVHACIAAVRGSDPEIIVELTPGISRDTVAMLKHAEIAALVPDGYAPTGPAVTLRALTGMHVVSILGDSIGDVLETQDTPAGGIMRLQCSHAVTATAPVTDAFIVKIDLEAGVITVKTPEAFLVVDTDGRSKKSPQSAVQDMT